MFKEKKNNEIRVVIQGSLKKSFEETCAKKYTTMSEVIRNMIRDYVANNKTLSRRDADIQSNK